jgi:hypothetical protein
MRGGEPAGRAQTALMSTASADLPPARAGPREHGRQAARSKRDRPGEHVSRRTDSATSTPP